MIPFFDDVTQPAAQPPSRYIVIVGSTGDLSAVAYLHQISMSSLAVVLSTELSDARAEREREMRELMIELADIRREVRSFGDAVRDERLYRMLDTFRKWALMRKAQQAAIGRSRRIERAARTLRERTPRRARVCSSAMAHRMLGMP